jgi:hypothetical protein
MYGLTEDFDPTVFLGCQLTQICFTQNTIHFDFSGDVSVTLESSFLYCSDADDSVCRQIVPVSSSNLMHLLGSSVDSATAEPDGTLLLGFGEGRTLAFLDDSKEYESYSIRIGTRVIIV